MTKKINDVDVYVTVEEADTYFNNKYGSNWADIAQTDKEKLIITATREIENTIFIGRKLTDEQPLQFPRLVCDEIISDTDINVIYCCCEIANALYNANLSNVITPNADKIQSMSVGDTSITYKEGVDITVSGYSAVARPIIKQFLGALLQGTIRVYI